MAETLGSLTDKISILTLKIYHMAEQTRRKDVDKTHIREAVQKIKTLEMQKNDIETEIKDLLKKYGARQAKPKIYRQFKMYNDPKYRL